MISLNNNYANMIAFYPLKKNALDFKKTYNGVVYGNIIYDGEKAYFGGSQYIDTTLFMPSITQYSFSVWINTNNSFSSMGIIEDFNSVGSNASARAALGFFNNYWSFNMGNNSTSSYNNSINSQIVRNGNWHCISLVINNYLQELYVDGVLFTSFTASVSAGTAGTQTYKIGKGGDWNGFFYNGYLKNLRIFNKALTPLEISQLYLAERTN